jgi:hypothetical protein
MGEQPVRGRREYDAIRERVSDLEAALRALTRHAPLDSGYAWGTDACAYCHAEGGAYRDDPEGRPGWRVWYPVHTEDCPWIRARSLLAPEQAGTGGRPALHPPVRSGTPTSPPLRGL